MWSEDSWDCSMARAATVRSTKKHCDRLWSLLVRERAGGKCERCGISPEDSRGFHAHHIYKRNNHRLRYALRNGMALCAACHRWVEEHPLEFAEWMWTTRRDDARWLMEENQRGILKRGLVDYVELRAELEEQLSESR